MLKTALLMVALLSPFSCAEAPVSHLKEEFPVLRPGPHGIDFSFIPGGYLKMGSPEDEEGRLEFETLHWVKLTQEYWMQTTEVTRRQWFEVMDEYPDDNGECKYRYNVVRDDDHPVVCVNWEEVDEFMEKLNTQLVHDGYTYRLPTEAEWEFATRGYTETRFSIKGPVDSFAWTQTNGNRRSHPVGELKSNFFGLYDVHGNAFEWVSNWFGDYPEADLVEDVVKDPKGPEVGVERSLRGGAWSNAHDDCRSALRSSSDASRRIIFGGFRIARTNR